MPDKYVHIILWVGFSAYLFARYNITGAFLGSYEAGAFESLHWQELLQNAGRLVLRTFWPPMDNSFYFLLVSGMGAAAYILLFIFIGRNYKPGVVWYFFHGSWLVSYLPYLSLGISTKSIESERFLYLPSLLFAICLCSSIFLMIKESKSRFAWGLILFLILSFHTVRMVQSSQNYRAAGNLVSQTMQAIKEAGLPHVFVTNLPETYKGIPMFRDGFEEGCTWLIGNDVRVTIQNKVPFAVTGLPARLQKNGDTLFIRFPNP